MKMMDNANWIREGWAGYRGSLGKIVCNTGLVSWNTKQHVARGFLILLSTLAYPQCLGGRHFLYRT